MRKTLISLLLISIIICFATISIVFAKDNNNDNIPIASYNIELTGDRYLETIQIIRKEKNGFELIIVSAKNQIYKIPLSKGRKPHVTFSDMNQDRIKDIFLSIPTKKQGTSAKYQIYTLKDEKLRKLILPKGILVTAQFENGYKASIQINQTGQSFLMDLKDQKRKFDKIGIYQNGLLNEPTELMITSVFSMKPVRLKDFSMGLKCRQAITDGFNEEMIGYIESTWKWSKSNWELKKMIVKKVTSK